MKKLIYSQEDLDLILSLETQEKDNEIDRLKGSLNTAIENIFTLLRVIDSNVKELKCSDEELKVINKYSYNTKGVEKSEQ